MNIRRVGALAALLVGSTGLALAQQETVDINRISKDGVGDKIGTVVVSEGKKGASFKISVKGCQQRSAASTFTKRVTAALA
jgi:hypothetical protein